MRFSGWLPTADSACKSCWAYLHVSEGVCIIGILRFCLRLMDFSIALTDNITAAGACVYIHAMLMVLFHLFGRAWPLEMREPVS